MQLSLIVTTADGSPTSVVVTPAAWIRWERLTKSKIGNLERDGLGLEDMARLAYESLPRDSRPGTFDAFVDSLTAIEPGPTANPTNPEALAV